MHGPDPSWCARLHAAPPARPSISTHDRPSPGTDPPATSPHEPRRPAETPAEDLKDVPADARQPTPFVYREVPSVHECEICGTVMYDHSCKIVCPNCGYKRDCSDP
jgi:hypothetical protein